MTAFFSSLRIRLLLIVFFASLPALGLIIYSNLEQRQLAKGTAQKEAFNEVLTIARHQKRVFIEAQRELAILAELPALRDQKHETCYAVLVNILRKNQEYTNLGVADRSGKISCSAIPSDKEINIADRPYFQQALKTRQFAVGSYQIGRISGRVNIGLAYPVLDRTGEVRTVIIAGLNLDWLQNMLAEGSEVKFFGAQGNITVIDKSGTILARWPEGEHWVGLHKPEVDIIQTVLAHGQGTTETYGLDGVHRLYAFSPLDITRQVGFVYAGIPTTILYAEANQTLARNLIFLGLALTLSLAAAWFLSSQLVMHRLELLLDAANRIAAGDLSARTGLAYGKGEIDHMARSFDEMARELQSRAEELHFANRILIVANQARSIDQLFNGFITELKNYTRCAAVGIRILREDGQIPYQAYQGFSQEFYEAEDTLSLKNDLCMCIDVIKGDTDPGLPYHTPFGSFYVYGATRFPDRISPEGKGRTRDLCNEFGYKSVALVPLRVGSRILGLIHVADCQEDMVPLRLVEVLEKVGMRLEQALWRLQAEESIRTLSQELMRAQELEREKISRELHDSVAQELAALKIGLENLQGDLPGKPVEAANPGILELSEKLQHTLDLIRNLSYDLRPPDLEHLGLVQAIKLHCEEVAARTGLEIDFRAAGIEAACLDYDAAINLFRIVQEGLTNVWRHARATKVNIRLVASFPKIILRLEDDGQGFEVSKQEALAAREKHMGLLGMRERVALLGGEMSLESQLKKGTKITIEIPWNGEGL